MIANLLGWDSPRNSLENPALSLTDPKTWDGINAGIRSDAGTEVTHGTALTYPAVWAAVDLISADAGRLPLSVFRRLPEDDREIDKQHPAHWLVNQQPNEEQTANVFWRQMMVHVLLWGNAYAYISRVGMSGAPRSLTVLLPDRTSPERLKDGTLIYATEVTDFAQPKALMPWQVLHLRGLAIDREVGLDLTEYARNSWGLALAQQKFTSRFFKNGARTGGILELPAAMTKGAKDTVEEGFRKTYETDDGPFRTVILRDNAKFHSAQVAPRDAQLVEGNEAQTRQVARWFRLPPSKLGIKDTVSYNSLEQENQAYLISCLGPHLDSITAECGSKLLTEPERRETHYFAHNASKLIETDQKTLNEVLEIQRRNEVISADEWRRKINLNKRPDGKGGEYANPNVKPAGASTGDATQADGNGSSDAADQPSKPSKSSKPAKPAKQSDAAAAARAELLTETINRMARRVTAHARTAAKKPTAFAQWIDSEAHEHRGIFAEALRPVLAVLRDDLATDALRAKNSELAGVFFCSLLDGLRPLLDPPYLATQLVENVESAAAQFEQSIAGQLVPLVLHGEE